MKSNVVFIFILCWTTTIFASHKYYQIKIGDRNIGYIQRHSPFSTEYAAKNTRKRTTFSYFKFENKPAENQQIFEKTIYAPPHKVISYSLEYMKGNAWEEYRYWFDKDSVTVTFLRGGKKIYRRTLMTKPNAYVITDYFSLLPLLQKTTRTRSLSVLDPKIIGPTGYSVPLQRLFISPKGQRYLTLEGKKQLTKLFLVKWHSSNLNIWMAEDKSDLLQIEDSRTGAKISLTPKSKLQIKITEKKSNRRFPFQFGNNYRYTFYFKDKKTGHIDFVTRKTKLASRRYKIMANGRILQGQKKVNFHSQTIYDENWQPVYYLIKEGEIQIECEFMAEGVKEQLQNKNTIVAQFIRSSGEFIFLDNNSMHHFAVAVSQLDLKNNHQSSFLIFHPRRMKFGPAELKLIALADKFRALLKTSHYQLTLTIDEKGRLLEYSQGNFKAKLSK